MNLISRFVATICIVFSVCLLVTSYENINKSDDSCFDASVPTKSVSSWDSTTDFSKMTAEEIVEYAKTHPKGFSLKNKVLIPCAVSPRGPESDPYSDMIPYDTDLEASEWVALTVEERMLASGYEQLDENGESFKPYRHMVDLPGTVQKAMLLFYSENKRNPVDFDELLVWHVNMIISPQPEGYEKYDINEAINMYFDKLTSPVTGKLVEIDNPNFSRGNIYVTIMDEKPEMKAQQEKLEKDSNFAERYPEVMAKREKYGPITSSYCRVFGETGVIFFCMMNHASKPS